MGGGFDGLYTSLIIEPECREFQVFRGNLSAGNAR